MIMTRSVTIELTPQLTAHAFCEMDAQQQAEFFNEVAHISNRWGIDKFAYQMNTVVTLGGLTDVGEKIMREIGEAAGE